MTDEELIKKYTICIKSLMVRFSVPPRDWDDVFSECKLQLLLAAKKYDEETLDKKIGWLPMKWITDYLTSNHQVHYGAYSYSRNQAIKNGTRKNPITNISLEASPIYQDDNTMIDIISFELYLKQVYRINEYTKFDYLIELIKPYLTKTESDLIALLFWSPSTAYDLLRRRRWNKNHGIVRTKRDAMGSVDEKEYDNVRKLSEELFPDKNKYYKKMKMKKLNECLRYQMKKRVIAIVNAHTNYKIKSRYNQCAVYSPIYTIIEPQNDRRRTN